MSHYDLYFSVQQVNVRGHFFVKGLLTNSFSESLIQQKVKIMKNVCSLSSTLKLGSYDSQKN